MYFFLCCCSQCFVTASFGGDFRPVLKLIPPLNIGNIRAHSDATAAFSSIYTSTSLCDGLALITTNKNTIFFLERIRYVHLEPPWECGLWHCSDDKARYAPEPQAADENVTTGRRPNRTFYWWRRNRKAAVTTIGRRLELEEKNILQFRPGRFKYSTRTLCAVQYMHIILEAVLVVQVSSIALLRLWLQEFVEDCIIRRRRRGTFPIRLSVKTNGEKTQTNGCPADVDVICIW